MTIPLAADDLDVGGYRLRLQQHGAGEPVILVHGSQSDYRTWEAQIGVFGEYCHVISYSRRYHWPNLPIGAGVDYSMSQHVDDLQSVIETLSVAPVHLVGHSYGAFICLLLVLRRPDLVRSLVLAEPPAITLFVSYHPKPEELIRLLLTRPRTALAIMKLGATGIAPASAAFRRGDMDRALQILGNAILGRETFDGISHARRQQARDNLIPAELLGSGFPHVEAGSVRVLQRPVLLLTGSRSPAVFHRIIDRLQELVPSAARKEIPNASHATHEDNSVAYNAAVLEFLRCSRP